VQHQQRLLLPPVQGGNLVQSLMLHMDDLVSEFVQGLCSMGDICNLAVWVWDPGLNDVAGHVVGVMRSHHVS